MAAGCGWRQACCWRVGTRGPTGPGCGPWGCGSGRRGVVSGPAAAWWHGMLPAAPDRVEVTVARRCGLRGRERRAASPPGPGSPRCRLSSTASASPPSRSPSGDGRRDRREWGRRNGRLGVPRPGAAAPRRVRAGVPVLLPQPRRIRLGPDRRAARRGGRPRRLGRRTGGRRPAAARGGHRLAAGGAVRAVDDRRGLPDAKLAVEVDGWAWHVDVDRFRRTGTRRTRSRGPGGRCSGSPGTTWSTGPPTSWLRSAPPWRDRRFGAQTGQIRPPLHPTGDHGLVGSGGIGVGSGAGGQLGHLRGERRRQRRGRRGGPPRPSSWPASGGRRR